MITNNLTFEIMAEDYVGDSVGKHNYNILSLDSSICNLSSLFFKDANNLYDILTDLANNVNNFNQVAELYLDPSRYNVCSSNTTLLSSYWNKHEFSVHYPISTSSVSELGVNTPVYNTPDERLSSMALSYIREQFNASFFMEGTRVNVIFFLYSVGVNPSDPNNLMHVSFSPEISFVNRYMTASYSKDDIHFTNGKIIKFVKSNGQWVKIDII